MRDQLRLTELIPRKSSTYIGAIALGVFLTLVLGGLYALGLRIGSKTTDGTVAAFDLDAEGSIGCWLSIVVWFCSGQCSLLVRRFRQALGASRRESVSWLAVASVWFVMSLDEGASLHEGFKELMVMVTGTRLLGDGSIYWAVPYFVVLSCVGLFLLVRFWAVRSAVAALLAAGCLLGTAVAGQLDLILQGRPYLETWIEESCELLGQLSILVSLGLYARHLVGAIEVRESSQSAS